MIVTACVDDLADADLEPPRGHSWTRTASSRKTEVPGTAMVWDTGGDVAVFARSLYRVMRQADRSSSLPLPRLLPRSARSGWRRAQPSIGGTPGCWSPRASQPSLTSRTVGAQALQCSLLRRERSCGERLG